MWYRSGTISLVQSSDIVTGNGTNWISQHQGWILVSAASGALHEIKEIISSTEVRLAAPVTDASASELGYFIIPTHSLNADLLTKINLLIADFDTSRAAWNAVYQDISAGVYQLWIDQGNTGTVAEFLAGLKGDTGDSAYQQWAALPVNTGKTFDQFVASLKGDTGASAFDYWQSQPGNEAKTLQDFLDEISAGAVSAASAARDDAQTARTDAETAKGAAETAQQATETALTGAVAAHDVTVAGAAAVAADRAAVAQIFDTFDDRYLGAHDDEPVADNDGDPLIVGAVFWDKTNNGARFWNGSNWEAPSASAAASAQQAIDAKLAALAAQGAAEAARDQAIAARDAAADSETKAKASETAAATSKADAATIQTDVSTMHDETQAAKTAAETARDEAQTALAAAQDDLGLKPVATSGDYADLTNKPQIIDPIAMAIALGS